MEWHSWGASAHLSAAQFMRVKDLASIDSVESGRGSPLNTAKKMRELTGQANRVGDYEYAPQVVNSMRRAIKNETIDPVHVNAGENMAETGRYGNALSNEPMGWPPNSRLALGNGGHRVALAQRMGAYRLPVAPDRDDTGSEAKSAREYRMRSAQRKGDAHWWNVT